MTALAFVSGLGVALIVLVVCYVVFLIKNPIRG
jgi:hypothetical protein